MTFGSVIIQRSLPYEEVIKASAHWFTHHKADELHNVSPQTSKY